MQQLVITNQIAERVNLSPSNTFRFNGANKFFKTIKISAGRNSWIEKDTDIWTEKLID